MRTSQVNKRISYETEVEVYAEILGFKNKINYVIGEVTGKVSGTATEGECKMRIK